jgi:microcystin-dependent protein
VATITKAVSLVNGSGEIKCLSATYAESFIVNKDNIQISGVGTSGKNLTTIQGKISTASTTTRLGVKDFNINNGVNPCLDLGDTQGRHVFTGIGFISTGADAVIAQNTLTNWLTFDACSIAGSTGTVTLQSKSSGTATATFSRCSGLKLSVGTNWTAIIDSCPDAAITNNGGTVLYTSVNSVDGQAGTVLTNAVKTVAQPLTSQQKIQACANIEAVRTALLAQPLGVATLDANGQLPPSQIPPVSSVVNTVNGQSGNLIINTVGEYKILDETADQGAWLLVNGRALSRVTYATLFNKKFTSLGACTISNANPAIITFNNHGLVAGDRIYFTTTGSLPTGLSTNTAYFVRSGSLTLNTFTLSTTYEGTAIASTSAGSGTHTLRKVANAFGLGDGSTTFTLPVSPSGRVLGMSGAGSGLTVRSSGLMIGAEAHVLSIDEMPSHQHTVQGYVRTDYDTNDPFSNFSGLDTGSSAYPSNFVGGSQPHNNMQPTFFAGNLFIFTGVYP